MRRRIILAVVIVALTAAVSPVLAQGTQVHVVQPGENLFRIALRYGTNYHNLAAANGITNPNLVYVGQRLTIPGSTAPSTPTSPPSTGGTYTVQRGDTLFRIALNHGLTTNALAQHNGIRNPALIYVGQVLRIPGSGSIPPTSPPPAPPPSVPAEDRWIDVNLTTQRVSAYEGNVIVRSTLVSTGLPATPTPTGQYRIYVKYLADDMSGPGYYLPAVPYTMYFYRGYSLHGTYWHSNFGHPMSHGCVNLPTPEAEWLYYWASVGTLVNVHY